MPSLLPKLTASDRKQFLADLNYLNMDELKSICKKHRIPYAIAFKAPDGRLRSTSEHDRKGIILARLKRFFDTAVIPEQTVFPASAVNLDPPPKKPVATDRLFYGHYDKKNPAMIALLKDLTSGHFKNGAIARILAREFWTARSAPTYAEFAAAWLKARSAHTRPNPEWAFLSDLADRVDTSDWKKLRNQKARRVLKVLDAIPPAKS